MINVPCSHVAHLELKESRSYRAKWTALIEMNYKRVAEVWFDDYKKYFYMMRPHLKVYFAELKSTSYCFIQIVSRFPLSVIFTKLRLFRD